MMKKDDFNMRRIKLLISFLDNIAVNNREIKMEVKFFISIIVIFSQS